MRVRGAKLRSLIMALPLLTASLPVAANENDDVMRVVDEVCVNGRDSLKEVTRKVSKLPFAPDPVAADKGPPPGRATWLAKLGSGSTLMLSAKSDAAPVDQCRLVSHVPDLADLVGRLKSKFDLGEPKTSDFAVQLTMKGQKRIGEKVHSVELVYGFEQNKPSGAFTLAVSR